jgi:hypothetical protein
MQITLYLISFVSLCNPIVIRNLRDLHLELINKLLLPQIVAILAPGITQDISVQLLLRS